MSYWIYLVDADDEVIDGVERHTDGGTYALGGTTHAELNVTYNYAPLFDFRALNGKQASDTVNGLSAAVTTLGTERDPDYWKATPGNAGYACAILLGWARAHPRGRWVVN